MMKTENLNQVCGALKTRFGERFSTHQAVLEQHCQDMTWLPKQPPTAVVFPHSTEEVSEIVKLCYQYHIPVIPYGIGSSLEGQVNAPLGGICLDLGQMDAVLQLYQEDMQVVVQAGVTRLGLNRYLRNTGLFFPIDPGTDATLGGMTATRASGTNAVRYGTMRDNVLSLKVVLNDGRVIQTGTRAKKSSAGYDLTKIFIGSEGTLGVMTEITLKLYGMPEAINSGRCAFPSIEDACQAVILASQLGIDLARIELLDKTSIQACNQYSNLNLEVQPSLFVEFHGSRKTVELEAERFAEVVAECNGGGFCWSTDEEERRQLWQARHDAWWAIHHLFPSKKGVSTDACVPISRLADCIHDTQCDVNALQLDAAMIGHVGDGNFHVLVMLDMDNADELERVQQFIGKMNRRAIAMGGTCTGEHGIGQGKRQYMAAEHGEAMQEMQRLKQAFDPTNILNPQKIFPSEVSLD